MDRRTVALGIAAAGAVAAAVVVTVERGHSGPSKQHREVAAYIESVDTVQQQMRVPLTNTIKAYREFSSTGATPRVRRQLEQAEQTLRALRRRIVAVDTPPQAAHLQALIVRLVSQEVAIAHEVAQLAAFSPRFGADVALTRAAGVKLSRALAAATPPTPHQIRGTKKQVLAAQAKFAVAADKVAGQQADAVDTYDAALAAALHRLAKLDPPPVLAPSFRTQVRTFEQTRAAGAALAAELRKKNRANVPVLGRRFTIATRSAGSVTAQKAEIAAIKAYNKRVAAIGNLQGRIQRELARLQTAVG